MKASTHAQAVILSAARTPVGRLQGTLNSIPAAELGATAIRAALASGRVSEVRGLLPSRVLTYIETHRLYGT